MSDFGYELDPDSIAIHPPSPRGSSKLVHVASNGTTTYHKNFEDIFAKLVNGCHLVMNDSQVVDARLFLNDGKTEMMVLDVGGLSLDDPCQDLELNVMIRDVNVKMSDVLKLPDGTGVEVLTIKRFVPVSSRRWCMNHIECLDLFWMSALFVNGCVLRFVTH